MFIPCLWMSGKFFTSENGKLLEIDQMIMMGCGNASRPSCSLPRTRIPPTYCEACDVNCLAAMDMKMSLK